MLVQTLQAPELGIDVEVGADTRKWVADVGGKVKRSAIVGGIAVGGFTLIVLTVGLVLRRRRNT